MKRFYLAVVMALCFGSTSTLFAAPSTSKSFVSKDPNTHQINLRLKNQMKLIILGGKSGKFTTSQTQTMKAGLKSIRQQELGFFKLNGNHELTPVQQTQLNQAMNANSTTLGETPVN